IEDILSRAQELKSDIFGFGNLIYRKNPRLWEKIGPRWDEEIFPRLKIDLKVNFVILRAGLIKDPL
ncbi:MAG TPA: Ger(x)C family spore germination C-terminal domain-containing protein, partial [Bacillota bacterium]|nr:Ger(x)C family spore germination C-terminal domain-containing protein [Bacillota bacterium]